MRVQRLGVSTNADSFDQWIRGTFARLSAVSWARAAMTSARTRGIHDSRHHPGALRFWGGTPTIAPYAIAAHSIECLLAIGVDRIRHHNLALGDRLRAGVPTACCVSPADPDARSGTVILDFAGGNDAATAALAAAGVAADRRALGFRLSPHIYNDAADVDAALAAFRQAGVA